VTLEELPTPFLAVDLDALEHNVAAMQARVPGRLRPHMKAHKCSAIAWLQMAAGAVGVTCSTTDEVTAMAAAGVGDLLLASVAADERRLGALAETAGRARVTIAVDSDEVARRAARAAREAGATLGVVVDVDIGMGRNGVASLEDGVRLADTIGGLPGLELRGVMAYEGHLVGVADRDERLRRVREAFALPLAVLAALRDRGFECPIFTGGATATYDAMPELSDVQAGTYVLMDATYDKLAPEFRHALAVVTTVTTTRPSGRFVVDAGAKRIARDLGAPSLGPGFEFVSTSEEHAVFQALDGSAPRVGDRVSVVPGHSCSTMALHNRAFGHRGGVFERALEIDARDPLA